MSGSCGPMDKASDYESGDSRFESWQDRDFEKCISGEAKIVAGKLDGANLTPHRPYEVMHKASCGLQSEDSRCWSAGTVASLSVH